MKKLLAFLYGVACYLLFLAVFLYLIAFVGDLPVPRTVNVGPSAPLGTAVALNVGLLLLFSLQHSVMARQGFKERWTRIVPKHLERSTYVLAASLVLALVMWGWRPIPETVWRVEDPLAAGVLHGVFWLGWTIVLIATFLIDHFRLFGLKQAWGHLRDRRYEPPEFQTPGMYRMVRHPLYLGFLLAFWSTPHMTAGHLLFAGVWTGWILVAIRMEERDLVRFHGDAYRAYRRRVRMLLPLPKKGPSGPPERSARA
jgi:protein-S-isoprenylcysteine O-methyltransferase Ste14